jgi:hypothetical protein
MHLKEQFGAVNDDSRVFTYANFGIGKRALNSPKNTVDLFTLWGASWARHGWKPYVITDSDVQKDSEFDVFIANATDLGAHIAEARALAKHLDISAEKEQLHARFRVRGITQFFAKAVVGAGVLTDSDVFNYGLTPQDVRDTVRASRSSNSIIGDTVYVHDGRHCTRSSAVGGGHYRHAVRALIEDGGGSALRNMTCGKLNNGVTSGSGAAYRRLVQEMLNLQKTALSRTSSDARVDTKGLELMTEMRMVNMLEGRGRGVAAALLAVTFNPDTDCWRKTKAVHFYGSGIKNWRKIHCNVRQNDLAVCSNATSRVDFVRYLRDPMQSPVH